MKGGPVGSGSHHHHHVRMDLEVQRHDDIYHPGQSKTEATYRTARAG